MCESTFFPFFSTTFPHTERKRQKRGEWERKFLPVFCRWHQLLKGGGAENRSFPSSFLAEKEAQGKKKKGERKEDSEKETEKEVSPIFLKEVLEKLRFNVKAHGPYLMSEEKYSQNQEKACYETHKS